MTMPDISGEHEVNIGIVERVGEISSRSPKHQKKQGRKWYDNQDRRDEHARKPLIDVGRTYNAFPSGESDCIDRRGCRGIQMHAPQKLHTEIGLTRAGSIKPSQCYSVAVSTKFIRVARAENVR